MKNTEIEHQIVSKISEQISSMKISRNAAGFNLNLSDEVSELVFDSIQSKVCDNLDICEPIYDLLFERN